MADAAALFDIHGRSDPVEKRDVCKKVRLWVFISCNDIEGKFMKPNLPFKVKDKLGDRTDRQRTERSTGGSHRDPRVFTASFPGNIF